MNRFLQSIATHFQESSPPLRVTNPADIQLVIELEMAGLIDAKISPPSKGRNNYGEIEVAIVVGLTDAGKEAARS